MNSIVPRSRAKFRCPKCRKRFHTKGGLNIHVKSHYPSKYLLECSYCEFTSFQKGNLAKHITTVHCRDLNGEILPAQFHCQNCPAKFITELKLQTHIQRKHTLIKNYKCQNCNYSSVELADLRKHIRICHTNERPFACESCEFRSHTSSGMARHRRTHTSSKPYKCSVCEMEYADKKRLREHLMKHSNLKPFSCNSCEYSTNRNDNLKTHIKRCHTIDGDFSKSLNGILF